MQKIPSSNPRVVTGICDPNKSQAGDHHSLNLGSRLKYLKIIEDVKNLFRLKKRKKEANDAVIKSIKNLFRIK